MVELVRARANSEHRIERIKDTAVLRLRNKLLPLMHLKKLLKIDDGSSSDPENGFIVVTQVGSQTFGIVVDGVFHTEEIVVKPMSTKAAAHRHVLRQHHSGRWRRDHDHRPQRHRQGARRRRLGRPRDRRRDMPQRMRSPANS